ncbi:hypothetical protein BMF94_3141 [Rhodotorula taiwanensis]|uniref:SH3 domain-containing protein n=1 Tax=Rhodotorula taiwanensis TaxID=741276 RepID=A0A2S5BA15_9BASI|nr:hypothetical protein BMF94_3141 [Rhodotorula taiwanensis]
MWAAALTDPQERAAFRSMLGEYFDRPFPTLPPPSTRPAAATATARTLAPLPQIRSSASYHSPAPATAAAPPATAPPRDRRSGPRRPAGLEDDTPAEQPPRPAKTGMFDSSSSKVLSNYMAASKAPPEQREFERHKALAPLYMKAAEHAIKSQFQPANNAGAAEPASAAAAPSHSYAGPSRLAPPPRAPPPMRNNVKKVRALYDYEGGGLEDLPIAEGEELTVVETVSGDWLKCRNSLGSEGLVPSSYVK